MKKLYILSLASILALGLICFSSASSTPTATPKIGVVNFKTCFEGSKLGQQEQARFEQIKKQLEASIEAKEKELNEMAPKFSEEYLDTLSPEKETELKAKFKQLSQELSQQQNQYYSMLQQAQYTIARQLNDAISQASKAVSQAKNLDLILNEEICFFNNPSFDVSQEVVKQMDVQFDKEATQKDAATKDAKAAEKK